MLQLNQVTLTTCMSEYLSGCKYLETWLCTHIYCQSLSCTHTHTHTHTHRYVRNFFHNWSGQIKWSKTSCPGFSLTLFLFMCVCLKRNFLHLCIKVPAALRDTLTFHCVLLSDFISIFIYIYSHTHLYSMCLFRGSHLLYSRCKFS